MNLKPYPAYKDSGMPGLVAVPEHWEVRRLKTMFREVDERTQTGIEPLLSLRQQAGLIDYHASGGRPIAPEALVRYKKTRPGQLVMNRMRAASGLFGLPSHAGLVSPDYAVFSVVGPLSLDYYLRFFRTPPMAGAFRMESRGLGTGESGFLRLYSDRFGALSVPYPPLPEQLAIVRFLGYADRRIQRHIRAKKKLIALLNEQKQAIILSAVTRGLDPGVRFKPSGVEWLGCVPEHWAVASLRRVAIARCDGPFGSSLKTTHYTDHGIRVVRLQNIGHAEFKDSDRAFIADTHYVSLGDHSILEGDLLIAGLGDERQLTGRACVAPASIVPAIVKADCFRFRLDQDRLNPEFAALHLTATALGASAILSTGATRQRMNLQATSARSICIPPRSEQMAIIAHVRDETHSLRVGIGNAHREIDLLHEYRTRLIADVVTGKLDVREAAARLPEEAEEPPLEDEALSEVEEGEDADPEDAPEEAVA